MSSISTLAKRVSAALGAAALLGGCDRTPAKPDHPPAATASVQTAPSAQTMPADPVLAPEPSAPAPHRKRRPLDQLPATRSKVPALAEWNAAPELTGPAISTLQECSLHVVREWLRLSCKKTTPSPSGNNQIFASVVSVDLQQGRDGETFTFVGKEGEIGSVVVPLLRGKARRALVVYTGVENVALDVAWPSDADAPTVSLKGIVG